MTPRNLSPRLYALPVAFSLLSVALLLLTFRAFGGDLPFGKDGYRLDIPLTQASNLVSGADVQLAGVKVGKVKAVRRTGVRGVAEVEIDDEYAPIGRTMRAVVRGKSLLGEAYIQLIPGGRGGADIADGGAMALRNVTPQVAVDEFLEAFDPGSRANLRSLFVGMSKAFDGRSIDLNETVGRSRPLTEGLARVLPRLAEQQLSLRTFIDQTGDVLQTVGEQDGAVRAAISAATDVLGATSRRNRALSETVRELPATVRRLRNTATTLTAASGDLDRAVTAVVPVAPKLKPGLDNVMTTAPTLRSVLDRLPATIDAGKSGLPAYERIVRTLPKTFDTLYPASRDLIPLMKLFSAYSQESLIAPLSNLAAAMNGTTVGPGGKIIQRTSGALFVSNETVGGWVKRLPTNRSNPYRKPGSFDDLARRGYLTSYDCRNLGNPAYLAPLGTGVPPCLEQGPFEYDGKTAYYPRLERAAP